MKKIIWIFGQPGAGRKTLINNLLNDNHELKMALGIETDKISVLDIPYDRERIYVCIDASRKDTIYKKLNEFSNSDNDIILIKGEYVDYDSFYDMIARISILFINFEKEILFLNPSNMDELYERMKATEWFQENYDNHLERYPKKWLEFAINHMREELFKYEKEGYKVIEIDTTNGYSIVNKEKQK